MQAVPLSDAREAAPYFFDPHAAENRKEIAPLLRKTAVSPDGMEMYRRLQVIAVGEPFQ